jgi:hypothetical protein
MKKTSHKLSIPIIALIMVLAASVNAQSSYYRHFYIDGNNSIVGKYPVPDTLAKKINCYHFVNDTAGRLIKVEYLACGRYCLNWEYRFAEIVIKYRNNLEKWMIIGKFGQDKIINGYDFVIYRLNENNHRISSINYETEGSSCNYNWGEGKGRDYRQMDKEIYTIDNNGLIINILKRNKNGIFISKIKNKYDGQGNKIEEKFFGWDRGTQYVDDDNISIKRYKYDDKGNIIEKSYFNKLNKLKEDANCIAIERFEYDDMGNIIEEKYFGKDEKLKANYWGIAIKRYKYDKRGSNIEETHYDAEDKLVKNGTAITRFKYNDNGYLIEKSYFDCNEKLKIGWPGLAIERFKLDNNGNILEESFFDASEKLTEVDWTEGWEVPFAISRYKYDSIGNTIEISHFGADGKLKEDNDSTAIYRYKYDNNNYEIEERYYGTDGKLKGNIWGIAIERYKYDDHKNKIEESHYDKDEKLVGNSDSKAICRYTYNAHNKKIEESFFGADEKLTEDREGIAIYRYQYDDKKNIIEEKYFDTDEKLKGKDDGVAIKRYKYDDAGNRIEESNYDTDEKLIEDASGFAVKQNISNDNSRLIKTKYFDSRGVKTTKRKRNKLRPINFYLRHRERALKSTPEQLKISLPSDTTKVFGVIIDKQTSKRRITIVTFQTGYASLIIFNGGITLEYVNNVAKQFVSLAQSYLDKTTKTETMPLPDKHHVNFYLLTNKGVFVGQETMKNLKNNTSPLLGLFLAGTKVEADIHNPGGK